MQNLPSQTVNFCIGAKGKLNDLKVSITIQLNKRSHVTREGYMLNDVQRGKAIDLPD